MALIECSECSRQVSDRALACLRCAEPTASAKAASVSVASHHSGTRTPEASRLAIDKKTSQPRGPDGMDVPSARDRRHGMGQLSMSNRAGTAARLVALGGALILGCGRGTQNRAVAVEASAVAGPASEEANQKAPSQASGKNSIREQLDRIDRDFRTPSAHPFAPADAYMAQLLAPAKLHDDDVPKLRSLARIEDPKMDPRGACMLVSSYLLEAPKVTFKMIRKNPKKYTGSAYWLNNVKIVEIHEDDGTTIASVSENGDIYFVASRFESPFVEGDIVDIVGYVGGEFDNEHHTMPAIAAAAIMKGDSVASMNRIMKWFKGL